MEPINQKRPKLLISLIEPAEELINNEPEETASVAYQNAINQPITTQYLEIKRFEILNRVNSNPKAEQDFRQTCALYKKQNPAPNPKVKGDIKWVDSLNKKRKSGSNRELERAYQEYTKAYHKATSLYRLSDGTYDTAFLETFDTEEESYKTTALKISQKLRENACLAVLSNGELFWYGHYYLHGNIFIIDNNYKLWELPWNRFYYTTTIYFKRNIYCFGGDGYGSWALHSSMRYDLDENRWVALSSFPKNACLCNSVICNKNILITEYRYKDLFLYSIDIDSFSTIYSGFAENAMKVLINAGSLYLIECNQGFVYENVSGDGYSWEKVGKSIISDCYQAYGLYNKCGIYIISEWDCALYYKFDLDKKEMFQL